MKRVAIIGTGIAGMAAAERLSRSFRLRVYERNRYVGGHTNTVVVPEGGGEVPVDTGFMVYNEVTYPRLTALFERLGVETMPTDMSFGVHHVGHNLYWGSRLPSGLFAQRRNLSRPAFWRMLGDVLRFNRRALTILEDPAWEDRSLGDFAETFRFSRTFLDFYLLPMTAAIWSSPHERMLEFPVTALMRFLHNHGLLGVRTQHPWRTVKGGSRAYREKLIAPYRDEIQTARAAVAVEREVTGATVVDLDGHRERFDAVVIATHADEALSLLAEPRDDERRLLGAFPYSANDVCLHTDSGVLPPRRHAWMSWNYRVEAGAQAGAFQASTHYWMNRLQRVSETRDYFVSVNAPEGLVDPARVLWQTTYHHPNFDLGSARAQRELPALNATGPVFFAGSYFRYGFHEDALIAGESAAAAVQRTADESAEVLSL